MKTSYSKFLDRLVCVLTVFFVLDRLLKLATVVHFFSRSPATVPAKWSGITLFQPITRGVSGLSASLRSRARLNYPSSIQHLLICDVHDSESLAECRALQAEFPSLQAEIIQVETPGGAVTKKTEELLAAIPHATGEVFWFLDDDVALRPGAARLMIPYLNQPNVGAVFGLACYTNWRTLWSSLMSMFVNANALLRLFYRWAHLLKIVVTKNPGKA
jgi:ceramide glucosyltransferase